MNEIAERDVINIENMIYEIDEKEVMLDTVQAEIIIIDRKIVFHCGASFKDLGKKCFAINEIENKLEKENKNRYKLKRYLFLKNLF